jgi:zinc transport system substrate-binding protein
MAMDRRHVMLAGLAALAARPAKAQARPVVVAVNYPLAWFAERLAGGAAEVRLPVPPGTDPQFWRPRIAEIGAIQAADLILLNGAGFAAWTARASLPRSRSVDTSRAFRDRLIATEGLVHSDLRPRSAHRRSAVRRASAARACGCARSRGWHRRRR